MVSHSNPTKIFLDILNHFIHCINMFLSYLVYLETVESPNKVKYISLGSTMLVRTAAVCNDQPLEDGSGV